MNQRFFWVKDGVLGEWLCIGTLGLKMGFCGIMALERDFWVKNVFFLAVQNDFWVKNGVLGGNGHAKGLLG